jgi:hypothetical protein
MSTSNSGANPSFAALAAAVAPQWGETIVRLIQATDRLAARFDQFIGAETERDTLKACRQLADELISFLDGLEDTDQDAAVDDLPCDGEFDSEPSLGSFDRMVDQERAWKQSLLEPVKTDAELDDCDDEEGDAPEEGGDDERPLGWTDREVSTGQYGWQLGRIEQ